ncbi:RnfABCDGE type electron transport complex subunit B [Myxococcota bacterium]|nr:RnfABCDGE type electron transport complex subunit B [Myxococcota bacterium]MBU1897171.1 RnfABCDGE type electron transport complex subunit B [Myxococcota bacterium]
MQALVTILLAGVILSLLAVVMGFVLGWANKAFYVEIDPKIEAIIEALPAANCGGCGYIGCGEYAEAVANGEDITLCGPGGGDCIAALAAIMGVEAGETFRLKAVVHCTATSAQRHDLRPYDGEQTCSAAHLVGGVQGCVYGCLGLADCVRVCNDDAIRIIDGVAVTNDQCTGCKACVAACPRDLISMIPFKTDRMLIVGCSNQDIGKEAKAVCDVACTGCKACTKVTDLMVMDGNLPVIDYGAYQADSDLSGAVGKCRTESLVFVGEPRAHPASES